MQFKVRELEQNCEAMQARLDALEKQINRSRSGRFQKSSAPESVFEEREGLIMGIAEDHHVIRKLHESITHKRKEWAEIETEVRRIYGAVGSTSHLPSDVDMFPTPSMPKPTSPYQFDTFISHAAEDKDLVARPLSRNLGDLGLRVWYDETVLEVGDSLRRSIDFGLSKSRFGVVVISPACLSKRWTQYELDSLNARQIDSGKIILPIWHKVSKDEVLEYSPKLADTLALHTSACTLEEIALSIALVVTKPQNNTPSP